MQSQLTTVGKGRGTKDLQICILLRKKKDSYFYKMFCNFYNLKSFQKQVFNMCVSVYTHIYTYINRYSVQSKICFLKVIVYIYIYIYISFHIY